MGRVYLVRMPVSCSFHFKYKAKLLYYSNHIPLPPFPKMLRRIHILNVYRNHAASMFYLAFIYTRERVFRAFSPFNIGRPSECKFISPLRDAALRNNISRVSNIHAHRTFLPSFKNGKLMKTLIDRKKESNKNLERKKTLIIYPSTIITRISADEIDHDAHLCRKRKKKNKKKKRERERQKGRTAPRGIVKGARRNRIRAYHGSIGARRVRE